MNLADALKGKTITLAYKGKVETFLRWQDVPFKWRFKIGFFIQTAPLFLALNYALKKLRVHRFVKDYLPQYTLAPKS